MNAKSIKSKVTAAFSLIELMVVIAIVALLTAIAVPSYQGYLSQSKVSEIFSLASDQMNQWEQQYTIGSSSTFDVLNPTTYATGQTTAALGSYVVGAELVDASTQPGTCGGPTPAGVTAVTALGEVCMQIASPSGIDTSLDGIIIYFVPSAVGSTATGSGSAVTGDTGIQWTCLFVQGSTSDPTTAASLLASGNCTAD